MYTTDLLIVGGVKDPNIGILASAAHHMGCAAVTLVFGDDVEPAVSWDLEDEQLRVDGRLIVPRAAFVRQDVFSFGDSMQPERLDKGLAWHAAITGACFSNDRTNVFNRAMDWRTASKPIMLKLARSHGLPVPETIVSNCEEAITEWHGQSPRIAKPVAGGAYCCELEELLSDTLWEGGVAPAPAIIQDRLDYPEYRVYIIGDRLLGFEVISEVVDYRIDRQCRIKPIPIEDLPVTLRDGLSSLAREVGIDFGAADFKTRSETGEICFLELNNQPMFAAHDLASDGELSRLIVETLAITGPERAADRRAMGNPIHEHEKRQALNPNVADHGWGTMGCQTSAPMG